MHSCSTLLLSHSGYFLSHFLLQLLYRCTLTSIILNPPQCTTYIFTFSRIPLRHYRFVLRVSILTQQSCCSTRALARMQRTINGHFCTLPRNMATQTYYKTATRARCRREGKNQNWWTSLHIDISALVGDAIQQVY